MPPNLSLCTFSRLFPPPRAKWLRRTPQARLPANPGPRKALPEKTGTQQSLTGIPGAPQAPRSPSVPRSFFSLGLILTLWLMPTTGCTAPAPPRAGSKASSGGSWAAGVRAGRAGEPGGAAVASAEESWKKRVGRGLGGL